MDIVKLSFTGNWRRLISKGRSDEINGIRRMDIYSLIFPSDNCCLWDMKWHRSHYNTGAIARVMWIQIP